MRQVPLLATRNAGFGHASIPVLITETTLWRVILVCKKGLNGLLIRISFYDHSYSNALHHCRSYICTLPDVISYSPRFFFIERRIAWQVELAFSNASCFISISDASVLEITLLIPSISHDTKSSYGSSGLCLMFEKEEVDSFS